MLLNIKRFGELCAAQPECADYLSHLVKSFLMCVNKPESLQYKASYEALISLELLVRYKINEETFQQSHSSPTAESLKEIEGERDRVDAKIAKERDEHDGAPC